MEHSYAPTWIRKIVSKLKALSGEKARLLSGNGNWALAYLPDVRTVTIDMAKLFAPANAARFDPTNNTLTGLGVFPNSGRQKFTPPGRNYAGDEDWGLLLATG